MLSRVEAERIAGAIAIVRPEWSRHSLTTLLAEFQGRDARDVALALVWLAYDPDTKTPGRLREDGPWWQLGKAEARQPGAPALRPFPPPPPAKPADPAVIAAQRARLRQSLATTQIPVRDRKADQ